MRTNIILCEGSTDSILIGHYLTGATGCKVQKIKDPPFTEQSIRWYINEDSITGIWPVHGTNFVPAVEMIAERERLEHTIEKIIVITDHDDDTAEHERPMKIYTALCSGLNVQPENITPSIWHNIHFTSAFDEADIYFYYMLVPYDEQGALETYMLRALSDNDTEKQKVISRAKDFIETIKIISSTYLQKRREWIKAELSVSMAVFEPDKSFMKMNSIIKAIKWAEFDRTHEQFRILREI